MLTPNRPPHSPTYQTGSEALNYPEHNANSILMDLLNAIEGSSTMELNADEPTECKRQIASGARGKDYC